MLPSLTSLRAISALYVFLFHLHVRMPLTDTPLLKNILDQGAVGMAFFFILSGFILAQKYVGAPLPMSEFYRARFARIYPAYAVGILLAFLLIDDGLSGSVLIANILANLLVMTGWFTTLFRYGINGGTWSLTCEFFFYALFPALLPVVARLTNRACFALLCACWLLSWLPGYLILVEPGILRLITAYSVPVFRLPEFVFGVCLGVVFKRGLGSWLRHPWIIILSSQVAMMIYLSQSLTNLMFQNIVAVPAFAILILTCASYPHLRFLSAPWLVWLGEISYGFYVFQFVVFYILTRHLADAANLGEGPTLLICLFANIFIAAVSFHLVERPLRRYIRAAGLRNAPPGNPARQ